MRKMNSTTKQESSLNVNYTNFKGYRGEEAQEKLREMLEDNSDYDLKIIRFLILTLFVFGALIFGVSLGTGVECNADMSVLNSTNFNCTITGQLVMNGTYTIYANGSGLGTIIGDGANRLLDCNGSTFIGDGSNRWFYASTGENNLTIINCNVSNYSALNIDSSNNIILKNNNFNNVNIFYLALITNLTFYNNTINNCLTNSGQGCLHLNSDNINFNISYNNFGLTSYRHIYQPINSVLNNSYIGYNSFSSPIADYSISISRNSHNNVFEYNTFFNLSSYAFRLDYGFNNVFRHNNYTNNRLISLQNGYNNIIQSEHADGYLGINGYGIHTFNETNFTIDSVNISNFISTSSIGITNFSTGIIENSFIYNNTLYGGITSQWFNNLILLNNTIDTNDRCFYSQHNNTNQIINNTCLNSRFQHDGYGIGFSLEYGEHDSYLSGNNITNYASHGFFIRQSQNITILDYYCQQDTLENRAIQSARSYIEPNSCIFISELYKSWYGDGTETIINLSRTQQYKSNNIFISGGTFGSNVDVYLRDQGGINVTHDLTDYIYHKFQIPNDWVDPDEFWIRSDFDKLQIINYSSITDELGQDWMYGYNRVILYKVHKDYLYFYHLQDIRDSTPSSDIVTKNNSGYNFTVFNKTSFLAYNTNGSIYGNSDISLNDGNINITLAPLESAYVLDNYNLTEGLSRENSPIWFSSTTSTSKRIASNLSDSITTLVLLDSSSINCDQVNLFSYTPQGGTTTTYTEGNARDFCTEITTTGVNLQLNPSAESNVILWNYGQIEQGICSSLLNLHTLTTGKLALLFLVFIIAILLSLVLGMIKLTDGKGSDTSIYPIVVLFIAVLVSAILVAVSAIITTSLCAL